MSRAKNKRKAAMRRRQAGPVRSIKRVPLSVLEAEARRLEIDRELYDSAFDLGMNMLRADRQKQKAVAEALKKERT